MSSYKQSNNTKIEDNLESSSSFKVNCDYKSMKICLQHTNVCSFTFTSIDVSVSIKHWVVTNQHMLYLFHQTLIYFPFQYFEVIFIVQFVYISKFNVTIITLLHFFGFSILQGHDGKDGTTESYYNKLIISILNEKWDPVH